MNVNITLVPARARYVGQNPCWKPFPGRDGFLVQVASGRPFSIRRCGALRCRGALRGETGMKRQYGFTLMELMIVVALILIIAAIAIPSMKEARMNANEASAVGSIRAINTAEVSYQAAYG